jgi:hypothetical protein
MLYTFRCAVYYASNTKHDSEKLKWWNWKDWTNSPTGLKYRQSWFGLNCRDLKQFAKEGLVFSRNFSQTSRSRLIWKQGGALRKNSTDRTLSCHNINKGENYVITIR